MTMCRRHMDRKLISITLSISILLGLFICMPGVVNASGFDLQAAIDAAESGDTIVLEDDVSSGVTIPEGKEITIDLNGYSIAVSEATAVSNDGVLSIKGSGMVMGTDRAISNTGSVSLLGGTYTSNSQSGYPVYNDSTGNMTIDNATVTANQGKSGYYAIYNIGDLTINKGSRIVSYSYSTSLDSDNSKNFPSGSNIVLPPEFNGNVVINGGYFSAPRYSFYIKNREDGFGSIEINGGEFYTSDRIFGFATKYSTGSITITGGNYISSGEGNTGYNSIFGGTHYLYYSTYNRIYYYYGLIPVSILGGSFSGMLFATRCANITIDGATTSFSNSNFIYDSGSIQLKSITSSQEISTYCADNGVNVYGAIIKIEDPSGKEMWYAGTEATKQVRNAAKGSKVTMIYGLLSTVINHDIYMTVPSSTSAYIGGNAITADGQEYIVHKDLKLITSNPCLSPDSPAVYYCSDCEKYYEDSAGTVEIANIDDVDFVYNHDLKLVPEKPATTTEAGYEAYYLCQVCGEMFSDAEGNNPITSPIVIPKLPDWDKPTYTWSDDYSSVTATRVLKDDPTVKETETVGTTSKITREATTTQTGTRTYSTNAFKNKAFTVQTKNVQIPMLPDWGAPVYQWASDYSSVTATRICRNYPTLKETETVGTTSKVKKEATAKQAGILTYTSDKFENPTFAVQTQDVEIPMLVPTKTPTKAPATPSSSPTTKPTTTPTAKPSKPTATPTVKPSKPTATPTSKPSNPTTTPTTKPTAKPTKTPSVILTLNKVSDTIVCGATDTLKATVQGTSSKVAWKSSDPKVATVDVNGKVTAKMAGAAIITASVAGKTATCPVTVLYKDVTNTKDFWYTPTNYLTAAGVVKGYDKQTKFKPANACTRAQMVTFIWRLQGEPEPKAKTCKFSDVKEKDYFYKACIWGNENHIVEGYKDGTFGPQIVCARKHVVTFLWRLAKQPSPKSTANRFKDVKKGDYYYTATLWASEKKILAGYADGTFRPDGDCLRRQMVTFLYKYDKFAGTSHK